MASQLDSAETLLALPCKSHHISYWYFFLPPCVALVAAAVCVRGLYIQKQKVRWSIIVFWKLASYLILAVLSAAFSILYFNKSCDKLILPFVVLALAIPGTAALALLSFLEHTRTVRPSTILCAYLVASAALDVVLYVLPQGFSLSAPARQTFGAMVLVKLCAFLLESQGKRHLLIGKWQILGQEVTSGLVGKLFLGWLNGLMIRGFRSEVPVSYFYTLDRDLGSEVLLSRLMLKWNPRHDGTAGKHRLAKATLAALWRPLAVCAIPRAFMTLFKLGQPLLLNRIIDYIGEVHESDRVDEGYQLIGLTAVLYVGLALSSVAYNHGKYRYSTMVRGALSSLVLHETVNLGLDSQAPSAVSLISNDVGQIYRTSPNLHDVWFGIIELGVALYLLFAQLGLGSIGPVVIVFLSAVVVGFVTRNMPELQKHKGVANQERIGVTGKIIQSMKEVKMLGLASTWLQNLQKLMQNEIYCSSNLRKAIVKINIISNMPGYLSASSAFAIAIIFSGVGGKDTFSLNRAFVSISIIELVSHPLAVMLFQVPAVYRALACFERLESFLDEAEKARERRAEVLSPGSSTAYNDMDQRAQARSPSAEVPAVKLEKATFRFKQDGPVVLQDLDLEVAQDSLTLIVGKVGCGKSALLNALLGEIHANGSIQRSFGNVAFCSETPWLVSGTIRKNIVGHESADLNWYSTVIRACALDRDFSELPAGDQTRIGTRGISLSGGQKQRVALARALFSKRDILIIDDVLGGLDWPTQKHVWHHVFGPNGLLRKHHKTVVLATHCLTNVEDATQIVFLGKGGKLLENGTYPNLIKNKDFAAFLSSEKKNWSTTQEQSSLTTAAAESTQTDEDEATDISTFEKRGTSDKTLWGYYFKHVGWKYITIGACFGCFAPVLQIFAENWLKLWAEKSERMEPISNPMYLAIFALADIGSNFANLADMGFILVFVTAKSVGSVHQALTAALMRSPLSFLVASDSGNILNRFSKDIDCLDGDMPINLMVFWITLRQTFAISLLVLPGSSYLAIAVPFTVAFVYLLQRFYMPTSRQLRYHDLQATGPVNSHVLELAEGVSTVRAFGWTTQYREAGFALMDEAQKPHYLLICIQQWLNLVLDLYVAVLAVSLVSLGVLVPDSTSKGLMAMSLVNILALGGNLTEVVSCWTQVESSLGAVDRIRDFDLNTPAESQPEKPQTLPTRWPALGQLEFKDMSASYSKAPNAEPVLRQLSLVIEQGQKVAIVGRTGSGKSSLVLSLFRMLDPSSGSICLDGMDISQVSPDTIREHLTVVPQEAVVFPGTVRSNLWQDYEGVGGDSPTDGEIRQALEKVELWEAVAANGGLDANVSGLSLSQGQKQLLCLCRATLRKSMSKLLVLDEAMSAVDRHTEDVMVRVLEEEFEAHTILSVVHKLNTIRKYDVVVVLDRGSIVEMGSPSALLEKPDGRFHALWNSRSH